MKQSKTKAYVRWIGLAEAAGFISGLLSRNATQAFGETVLQPPLSPPAIVFPIVWTILYALMGIGAARVVQLIVNFFWSLIFFNAGAYGFAFLWLLLLIAVVVWMILSFRRSDPLAAMLQIPYLLWLIFAAYLNSGVWTLNG